MLRVTETFDLMPKRIYHRDVFTEHLGSLVNQMDEEGSLHPHVADAFYNSFRTYKGRLFLLVSSLPSVGGPYELTGASVRKRYRSERCPTGPIDYSR